MRPRVLLTVVAALAIGACTNLDRSFEGTRCDVDGTCGGGLVCCEGHCKESCSIEPDDAGGGTGGGGGGTDDAGFDAGFDAGGCSPAAPDLLGPVNGKHFGAAAGFPVNVIWTAVDAGSSCALPVVYSVVRCEIGGGLDGGCTETSAGTQTVAPLPMSSFTSDRTLFWVRACAGGNCAVSPRRYVDAHRSPADLDHDGFSDVVLANGSYPTQTLTFQSRGGANGTVIPDRTDAGLAYTFGLTTGDCNGDGVEDLFVATNPITTISDLTCFSGLTNSMVGFVETRVGSSPIICPIRGINSVGDVDGDGDDDVVSSCSASTAGAAVLTLVGSPPFKPAIEISLGVGPTQESRSSPLGDVDSDGLADFAVFSNPRDGGAVVQGLVLGRDVVASDGGVLRARPFVFPSAGPLGGAVRLGDSDLNGREEMAVSNPGVGFSGFVRTAEWQPDGGLGFELGGGFATNDYILPAGFIGTTAQVATIQGDQFVGVVTLPLDGGFGTQVSASFTDACAATRPSKDISSGFVFQQNAAVELLATCDVGGGASQLSLITLPPTGASAITHTNQSLPVKFGRLINEVSW